MILIISISAAAVLIIITAIILGITLSKPGKGGNKPHPIDDDKITLSWGQQELINIDDLTIGDERGPYKVGLVTNSESSEQFTGTFSVNLTSNANENEEYKLINYLYVDVYQEENKNDLLFSINPETEVKSINTQITVSANEEKLLYFYIGLDDDLPPYIFTQLNDDVSLVLDWGI